MRGQGAACLSAIVPHYPAYQIVVGIFIVGIWKFVSSTLCTETQEHREPDKECERDDRTMLKRAADPTQHPQYGTGSRKKKAKAKAQAKAREFAAANARISRKKAKKAARKQTPLAERTSCNHFLKKKNRYCCMSRTTGTLFCGVHQESSAGADEKSAVVELTVAEKVQLADLGSFEGGEALCLASSTPKLLRVPPFLYLPTYSLSASLAANLRDLDLSCNEMKELPAAICRFQNLTSLNVSRNFIRRLPSELGRLKKLVTLNASSNMMRSLATLSLDAISTLNTGDAGGGGVSAGGSSGKGCTALRLLDLRHIFKIGEKGQGHLAEINRRLGAEVTVLVTPRIPVTEKDHAADRDATLIRSQIEPHCTGVLRRRLAMCFGETTNPGDVEREEVIRRLLAHHEKEGQLGPNGEGLRRVRKISGVPVSKAVCDKLLCELEKWVANDIERRKKPGEVRERTNINAGHYMILSSPKAFTSTAKQTAIPASSPASSAAATISPAPSRPSSTSSSSSSSSSSFSSAPADPSAAKEASCLAPACSDSEASAKAQRAAAKLARHADLWEVARCALAQVDPAFAEEYTAVAFTKNFVGSPHIDTQNTGPFYGLALGDFKAPGGALCVECSAREIAEVDTREKLGRVDGRFPHWVAPYEGNRYSVIFYKTCGGEAAPRTTAVFSGRSLAPEDAPTFPVRPEDKYYRCYDRETNTYAPSA